VSIYSWYLIIVSNSYLTKYILNRYTLIYNKYRHIDIISAD